MNTTRKIILHTLLIAAIAAVPGGAYAIGEFGIGFNLGLTYAPNNTDDIIARYNGEMMTTAGADVNQLNTPYVPVVGINLRYQFNYLLFRIGCHLATPVVPTKGSITVGGNKNTIRISAFQNSIPATIGLLMPVKKRTYFYIGGGGTLHQAYIKISQSAPDAAGIDIGDDNRKDSYFKTFVGYHLLLGAEVPLSEKVTMTTEWIHQEGRSYPINNHGTDSAGNPTSSPKKAISVKGDVLLFGVSYYIQI
ncbi:MAG TPA: outer membrane beta-barrel protein [Spirochaetota bacterium]|nr:outer membrane beta-barrel protein [Spirochaetota bacterium]